MKKNGSKSADYFSAFFCHRTSFMIPKKKIKKQATYEPKQYDVKTDKIAIDRRP